MVAASYGVWDQLALTLLGGYGTFLPLDPSGYNVRGFTFHVEKSRHGPAEPRLQL
ncbi:unnamed protein product [marine sediment metagenome]|uniref:Uncharacterized protein n=1 Tax=marine sediment metagenome TaxID=412755 RepID=X1U081_9ZZZZ